MNINYYNPYVRQELELYHHGILGQRWGKKNGPPYPLGASDHSASEKRAGWRKSLAGGARAIGRGVAKGSKLAWRGTKAVARGTNKALLRMNLKPKRLMSDQEIVDQINRLRQEQSYKNALKGRFRDVTNYEKKRGEGALNKLMSSVGSQVVLPLIVNGINYKIASSVAKATGDKAPSMVESIFGKSVRFRDGERYMSSDIKKRFYDDSDGRTHLILDTRKKDSGQGKGKKDKEGGDNSPKKEKKQQTPQDQQPKKENKQQDQQVSESKPKYEPKSEPKQAERDSWLEQHRQNATVPQEYQKKESLSSRTQSLNQRTVDLFNKGSASKILEPIRKEQTAKPKEQKELASIWATVPSVKKTMSSAPVKNTLQTKMSEFNSFVNKNRFRTHDFDKVYQQKMDSLSVGDVPFDEYIRRLSRM